MELPSVPVADAFSFDVTTFLIIEKSLNYHFLICFLLGKGGYIFGSVCLFVCLYNKQTNSCKYQHKSKNINQIKKVENTDEVIKWYNNIENEQKSAVICIDVFEFSKSITEELLNKALNFTENYTTIRKQDRRIIVQAK